MKKKNRKLIHKKKSYKGMTLIEVIVAMVVLIVASSLLVQAATSVIVNMNTARSVVSKVNEETPSVENKIVPTSNGNGSLNISYNGGNSTINVARFDAESVAVPEEDQRCGDLKYFEIN